ncbi:MAG: hypothetical protein NXY57DRAFT_969137 [Lentinula lateritia]|nr:MAG: hypothetical protein NXY57DRAFT_969137 [Lentinula lateritia]
MSVHYTTLPSPFPSPIAPWTYKFFGSLPVVGDTAALTWLLLVPLLTTLDLGGLTVYRRYC